ncbi:Uncharacterised protein [Mycobacterium tuberculosis]|nr:Uncharacterised protein [Mycobacterium tuberculosis]
MIVVTADSRTTSLMPARSVLPIGDSGSIRISMCKPWLTSNTDQLGEPSSPVYPANCPGSASPVAPSGRATASRPSSTVMPVALDQESEASGTAPSRNLRA